MKLYIQGGGEVTLTKNDFVAQGGEGSVYAKGATAFKIYIDPTKMIPQGKIAELSAIDSPFVVKPEKTLLDAKGAPIGLAYRFVKDSTPLCKLFTRAFREREGLHSNTILALVKQMRETVESVHKAQVLIVDLNEMNLLTASSFRQAFFIDVDSWQTPHYRATALMESVRDRHAKLNEFSQLTDWFAFGIVTFQLLIGIHPYKGKHPTVKELDERMRSNLSVFNKDVTIPKVCYPFAEIPPALLNWYRAVFEKGERMPPPTRFDTIVVTMAPSAQVLTVGSAIDIQSVAAFSSEITAVWAHADRVLVGTQHGLFLDGVPVHPSRCDSSVAAGWSPRSGHPVILSLKQGALATAVDIVRKHEVPFGLQADQISTSEGRVYVKVRDKILEVCLSETPSGILPTTRVAADVLERASYLFEGGVYQDLLGEPFVSLFPRSGATYQLKMSELKGARVLSAKYDNGVLMVIGERGGIYDRFVFRFDSFATYDARVVRDVGTNDINFVTLDNGVCVCLNEDERLEVFSNRKDDPKIRLVEDKALNGAMRLVKLNGRVGFFRDNKLFRLSMKA